LKARVNFEVRDYEEVRKDLDNLGEIVKGVPQLKQMIDIDRIYLLALTSPFDAFKSLKRLQKSTLSTLSPSIISSLEYVPSPLTL